MRSIRAENNPVVNIAGTGGAVISNFYTSTAPVAAGYIAPNGTDCTTRGNITRVGIPGLLSVVRPLAES